MKHIRSSIQVLSRREIERIHQASVEVLRQVGVEVPNERLLQRLRSLGADLQGPIVRIPEQLLDRVLGEVAPARRMRSPWSTYRGQVRVDNSSQTLMVDYPEMRRRPGTLDDVLRGIVLSNALPTVARALPVVVPSDVPLSVAPVESYRLGCLYSRKPFHVFFGLQAAPHLCRMAAVLAEATGRPRRELGFGFSFGAISPLRFAEEDLATALLVAGEGWPVSCYSFPVIGTTAPASLAGALVLSNAERLACLVLMWLWGEGGYAETSVDDPCIADPRSLAPSFGHPNITTFAIANSQLCRFYGLRPGGGLALSDAKQVDFQSGFERGTGAILSILSGGGIGPSGIAGTDEGASLEKLVIEDAALSALNWIGAGVEVTDESLAVDLIKEVGIAGTYLDQPHTARYLRREFWSSPLFPRETWTAWEERGGESLLDRAHRQVQRLLAEGYPPPLVQSEETVCRLEALVAAARQELA